MCFVGVVIACGCVVSDFDACGYVVSVFLRVWVGTHTCTWAHNLGFPDGMKKRRRKGEVSEEKATSFGCGVCSVRLPVLQIFKYRTARN